MPDDHTTPADTTPAAADADGDTRDGDTTDDPTSGVEALRGDVDPDDALSVADPGGLDAGSAGGAHSDR